MQGWHQFESLGFDKKLCIWGGWGANLHVPDTKIEMYIRMLFAENLIKKS